MKQTWFALIGFSLTSLINAQTPPQIASVGYVLPSLPRYAPGQVLSLFVSGLRVSNTKAVVLPLPTTLEGVTASAVEKRAGGFAGDLPIFGLTNSSYFGGASTEASDITVLTVQMPALPTCLPDQILNPCWYIPHVIVTVKQNGMSVASSEFVQTASNLHVLNACDTSVSPFIADSVKIGQMLANCYPIITHADGTVVTGHQSPARGGEIVTIYTTGMGFLGGRLGAPAPEGGVALDQALPTIGFDFRPEAIGGIYNVPATGSGSLRPEYVGLVSGLVGIEQVNVRLPSEFPPETRKCQGFADTNLGINIERGSSLAGVRLCVLF